MGALVKTILSGLLIVMLLLSAEGAAGAASKSVEINDRHAWADWDFTQVSAGDRFTCALARRRRRGLLGRYQRPGDPERHLHGGQRRPGSHLSGAERRCRCLLGNE